jgi:hypothetical protein
MTGGHLASVALAFLAGGAAILLIFGSFIETHSRRNSVGRVQPVVPSSSAAKPVAGAPRWTHVLLEQPLPPATENSRDSTPGVVPAGRRSRARRHDGNEVGSSSPDRKLRRRKKQAQRRAMRNADEDASTTPNDGSPTAAPIA